MGQDALRAEGASIPSEERGRGLPVYFLKFACIQVTHTLVLAISIFSN